MAVFNRVLILQMMRAVCRGHGVRYASFIHQEGYIGGRWVPAASGKLFPVTNPATGEVGLFSSFGYSNIFQNINIKAFSCCGSKVMKNCIAYSDKRLHV